MEDGRLRGCLGTGFRETGMSIHEKSKLYNIVSSVSMKIILTMLLMILPLNVIVLIYTYNMQEGMIEREELNHQKRAEYFMQSISNTMDNARSMLRHFAMEDQDCFRILDKNSSDYTRESVRLKLHYKIKNMASMADGADGYFFDFRESGAQIIYAARAEKSA